jgi:hypothetical protein
MKSLANQCGEILRFDTLSICFCTGRSSSPGPPLAFESALLSMRVVTWACKVSHCEFAERSALRGGGFGIGVFVQPQKRKSRTDRADNSERKTLKRPNVHRRIDAEISAEFLSRRRWNSRELGDEKLEPEPAPL